MLRQYSFLDLYFMLNFISTLKIGWPVKKTYWWHQNIEESHIVPQPNDRCHSLFGTSVLIIFMSPSRQEKNIVQLCSSHAWDPDEMKGHSGLWMVGMNILRRRKAQHFFISTIQNWDKNRLQARAILWFANWLEAAGVATTSQREVTNSDN